MTDSLYKLNDFQLDVLREIGNIGAGNAATALSKLLGTSIDMNVPSVEMVGFDDIADVVGGFEQVVVGIFLRMTGDLSGSLFFLLALESARKLLSSVLELSTEEEDFNELELSALSEMGNILAGSYLTALADFTNKELQPSVPALAIDMAGAILSIGLLEAGEVGDTALVVDTKFRQGNQDIEGHFFLLPDPGTVSSLFQYLGVNPQ